MKVGIVTQPLCANYGGILQNFALQRVLKTLGHTPVTLDYMPSLSFGRYLLYAGKWGVSSLLRGRDRPLKPYRHFLERPAAIDAFVQKEVSVTRTLSRYSATILKKNGIDAIIVGSDQVWRYAYNSQNFKDMFLAFAKDYPCRKFAYAASFGVDEWDCPNNMRPMVKRLERQFDSVSVREDSGAVLCKEHFGVKAEVVLDPTLLLSASEYEVFCKEPTSNDHPYMAAYVLDMNKEKEEYIENVARVKNLEIKYLSVSSKGVSIEEWLTILRNAGFIITDSYHGSLFSIIFKKQFRTITNRERGADRFSTLFQRLRLMEVLIDSADCKPDLSVVIDYDSVLASLRQLQDDSISFIRKSLGL